MIETTNNLSGRNNNFRDSVQHLRENQLEALKSLALLLLRELESLQKTPQLASEVLDEDKVCLYERTQQFEVDLIRAALIKTNGNQRRAAKLLGTKETTLNTKIKRYSIDLANQHSESATEKSNGKY